MAIAVAAELGAASGGEAAIAPVRVLRASPEEREAHAAMCERIQKESQGKCLWLAQPAAVPA
jgi:hypothetical protein